MFWRVIIQIAWSENAHGKECGAALTPEAWTFAYTKKMDARSVQQNRIHYRLSERLWNSFGNRSEHTSFRQENEYDKNAAEPNTFDRKECGYALPPKANILLSTIKTGKHASLPASYA